ncbi:MAG: hypothetical protein EBX40_01145 [Gammaproteobacteria bacterium]|nr:hypothetical protein [Gammaproteobacteria bacterium]
MSRFNETLIFDDPAINNSFVTAPFPVKIADKLAFQFTRTGTIDGVVSLEASLDGNSWSTVPDSVQTVDSTVQTYIIELRTACSPMYRVSYAHTAGLGECKITTYIKGS